MVEIFLCRCDWILLIRIFMKLRFDCLFGIVFVVVVVVGSVVMVLFV